MEEQNQNSAREFTELSPELEIVHQPKFVDYQRLEELLQLQQWREADKETAEVLLAVLKQVSWWDVELSDIEHCASEDLAKIDQLWMEYSQGHFGFSVQWQILTQLGGKAPYNRNQIELLGYKLGWLKRKQEIDYQNLTFDLSAPPGHLPRCYRLWRFGWNWGGMLLSKWEK